MILSVINNKKGRCFVLAMGCELCGNPVIVGEFLIEGVEMDVCKDCSKCGKPVVRKSVPSIAAQKVVLERKRQGWKAPQSAEELVDNIGGMIRKKRSKLGLTQGQLAKMVAEKESIINKIEGNSFTPSLALARKIGHILKLTLVEKGEDKAFIAPKSKGDGVMTLGDMIKIRKR